MLNIAITFDYELFLGANYASDDEILFSPTDRIIKLLNLKGVTSTFFADVCSVAAHGRYGLNSYVSLFENQLRQMVESGHDVQLHLHPNWLLSEYIGGQWDFNTSHYRLHDFGFDAEHGFEAQKIIHDGKAYLEKTLQIAKPDYKCIAYRAGGYSVQPHADLFGALRDEGIIIDSSVCSKQHIDSSINKYDFRYIPKTTNWWIEPDKDFSYEGSSLRGVFEVPIPADKNSLPRRLFTHDYSAAVRRSGMLGAFTGVAEPTKKRSFSRKLLNYFNQSQFLTLDSIHSARMIPALCRMEKKYKKQDAYIALICHPKLADEGVIENMDRVVSEMIKHKNVRFVNMADIYTDIIQ